MEFGRIGKRRIGAEKVVLSFLFIAYLGMEIVWQVLGCCWCYLLG